MKYWSRPHVDHVFFITSRFHKKQMVNGIVHFDMENTKAYSESIICSKIYVGVKYLTSPTDRVLLVIDDQHPHQYLQSLELHKSFADNNGTIFITHSNRSDKYMGIALEAVKKRSGREDIMFNTNSLEMYIPHTDNWRYVNSKEMIKEYK